MRNVNSVSRTTTSMTRAQMQPQPQHTPSGSSRVGNQGVF